MKLYTVTAEWQRSFGGHLVVSEPVPAPPSLKLIIIFILSMLGPLTLLYTQMQWSLVTH